uniref:Uncharacterized protein n=1 Tax=Brassica campestris TaxID=3711 RepID=A0A3P5YG35_BRACM|nr:unnamed protein product [Brassica rapa]
MLGETTVPPSLDPQNGVFSKDSIYSPEKNLSIRIYLPEKASFDGEKLPFLIYFHGGGFIVETAFSPTYHTLLTSTVTAVNCRSFRFRSRTKTHGMSETPLDELEPRDEAMRKMIEGGWRTVSPNSVNGADDPLINVVGSGDSDLFGLAVFCAFIVYIESGKMYIIESKGGAIACMLLALLFLGTWPAIMTLTERRGRLPQHTYLDYTITNLLAAVIIAFTLGQIGPSRPNFITQLSQDNWQSVMFAMAGGIVLSLGNLATQYAWAFVGLSVTEVVTSSITVVIGTTLNYFLDDRINRAEILFPGAACFLIAVCFGSAVHKSNAADNKSKLQNFNRLNNIHNYLETTSSFQIETNHANSGLGKEKAKEGTAAFLIELEKQRAIKVFGKSTIIGLAITFFAGICFSMFSPAFNLATNDQWHTLKHGVPKLTVYTAFFYFSISAFVIALILNIRFLYWPVLGLPRSSFKGYLNDWNGRGWSFLAGFLCGFGNGLQFMGGQAAGYAAADAVQALPLVSTFWGILLFGEYRRSSRRTYVLLISMLFMFIVAVAVLMASSGLLLISSMLCSPLSSLMIPTLAMAKLSSRRGSKSTILTTPLNSKILQKPTGTFKT